jgi:hydrogenase maturation protease
VIAALAPVRVLGLGNVLMGDDALGPWVIEDLLARWEFPEGVSVVDVGTPGLDLTPYLADAETVILVDTVKAEGPPGAIRVYSRGELLARGPQPRVSPHDPGLAEALFSLDFAGCAPKSVTLVGVVPEKVEKGVRLSPAVRAAVPAASEEIAGRLAWLGLRPRRRPGTRTAPWWEAAAPETVPA